MRRLLVALSLLAGALCLTTRAATVHEASFISANGFILVEGQLAGHPETLTFLVDTGASASVLDVRTAKRLRVPLGRPERVLGVGSEAGGFHLTGAKICQRGQDYGAAVLAIDLRRAEPLCGRPVDGLLGMTFFKDRIVQIDYPNRKLRLLDSAPAATGAMRQLPLRRANDVFCAAVSVNGSQPRWTRLDTGCNDALHWVVPRGKERRRTGATIGFIDEERNVTRASVRLGGVQLEGVETSLHGQPLFPGEAGLLGNGVLNRYAVTIDGQHSTLYLAE